MPTVSGNTLLGACLTLAYLGLGTGDFKVSQKVQGGLGESVTLKCRLEGYYRWYVISWIRRETDGTEDTIVRLPSDSKIPEWAKTDRKSGIKTKITIQSELTEFNLVIDKLACEDRGLYVCKYVGKVTQQKVLQLSVRETALKPNIHVVNQYVVVEMNTSFVVDCKAKVGYPPKRLIWLSRSKVKGSQFKVIPNNRPMQNSGESVCNMTVVQPLEIFANRSVTRLIYRCAYEGEEHTRGLFDEVSVRLPAVVVKSATDTHDCMKSGSCPMEARGDFKVSQKVQGGLGESVTLKCRLEGYYRWYVISWIRRETDGTEDTIVRLPSDSKIPEWAKTDRKSGIKTKITIQSELTEFNLVIDKLACEDRGLYVCKYVGKVTQQKVLQLSVRETALKPNIHVVNQYVVVEMNTSFVVDCKAKVGYPPKRLIWLSRSKVKGSQFKVIPNNRPMQNSGESVCNMTVVQPLEIFANRSVTRLIYRCAYEGEEHTRGLFDEVSVRLPAVVVKSATDTHDCMKSGSCPMEARDRDYTGSGMLTRSSCFSLMLSSLFLTAIL